MTHEKRRSKDSLDLSLHNHQHLDGPGPEIPPSDHVENSARSSGDDVLSVVELPNILADISPADAGVTLDRHVIAQRQDNLKRGNERKRFGQLRYQVQIIDSIVNAIGGSDILKEDILNNDDHLSCCLLF